MELESDFMLWELEMEGYGWEYQQWILSLVGMAEPQPA